MGNKLLRELRTRHKIKIPKVTSSSRNVLIDVFYNLLDEEIPLCAKDKLPTIGLTQYEKMKSPLAKKLIEHTKLKNTISSYDNINKFIAPKELYMFPKNSNSSERALLAFNTLQFGNVERMYNARGNSVKLNLDKKARNAFYVDKESVWVSFDWCHAELNFLCSFSGDTTLYQDLQENDFFGFLATESLQDTSKRDLCKTLMYTLIYSNFDAQGVVNAHANKDVPEASIVKVLEFILERYPKLVSWSKEAIEKAIEDGGIKYYGGFRKLDIEKNMLQDYYKKAELFRQILNVYGQNSVGHLLKTVLSGMWKDPLIRYSTSNIIPLFDSLVFQVKEDALEEVLEKMKTLVNIELTSDDEASKIIMKSKWKMGRYSWGGLDECEV